VVATSRTTTVPCGGVVSETRFTVNALVRRIVYCSLLPVFIFGFVFAVLLQ
jgi:hypothetical protein